MAKEAAKLGYRCFSLFFLFPGILQYLDYLIVWENGGQVVEWVLAPVRARWQSPAWQAALASPAAFFAAYMPLSRSDAGFAEARGDLETLSLEKLRCA